MVCQPILTSSNDPKQVFGIIDITLEGMVKEIFFTNRYAKNQVTKCIDEKKF